MSGSCKNTGLDILSRHRYCIAVVYHSAPSLTGMGSSPFELSYYAVEGSVLLLLLGGALDPQ